MKVRVSGGSTGPETGGCCAFHLKPLALSRTLTGEVSQWLGPDPPDHGGVVKREKSHELALESRDAVCVACVGVQAARTAQVRIRQSGNPVFMI